MKYLRLAFFLITIFSLSTAIAAEFRAFRKIATPAASARPEGARAVEAIVPVDKQAVEAAIREVFTSWNSPGMTGSLSGNFYDAGRLGNSAQSIPKDARIDVLSVSGIQTIGQYIQPPETGSNDPAMLVSEVSITVRTQIVYNDLDQGYQRIEGTNEYIVEVSREMSR
ncbi:MAG: hypothetical protein JEZ11_25960 [Desulfobacterales bacterium]|nr:hypothetical protein [Desulfobacterales bacterium]